MFIRPMVIRIETRARVWQVTVAVTLAAAFVVTAVAFAFYAPDERPFELGMGLSLVGGMATPFVYAMASQMHRNSLMTVELQRLVDRDRLTDVATRDRFFGRMAEEPDERGISLMIDIDHFKRVNDTYGHPAGDQVLREVAAAMKAIVRDVDIVARFGGEEFVVFLHDADVETGYRVAERMRAAIARNPVTFEGERMEVTVSIGGSLKEAGEDIRHAIREADDALYRAKDEGRNRTVFAGGTPDGEAEPLAA